MNKTQIDRLLKHATERQAIAGVVAIAANADTTLYEGAAGLRLLGADAPMTIDTVFAIASMTKAVTATAAMQLVEQGRITLDEPLGRFAPQLAAPQVLEGFDSAGKPILRPARGAITLRHLMTHTAGFGYDIWNKDLNRYLRETGIPGARTGKLASLDAPLVFDPGARWEYSIAIDWIGRIVEAISGGDLNTYFRAHLFDPLGMTDTGFLPTPAQAARAAGTHLRNPDGTLTPTSYQAPRFSEFFPGGGGLFSTAPDYIRFCQAFLNGGAGVLKPETVALMGENHMGALNVLPMLSSERDLSNDVELFPGMTKKWGLSFLINTERGPSGRSAGSLCWAGLRNSYYWIDPVKKIAGVLMTQTLPFADAEVLGLLDAFEAEIYRED
jgi:CubicO group peptidase (beta-lactamase class C family)